jgi:hypothetical protein
VGRAVSALFLRFEPIRGFVSDGSRWVLRHGSAQFGSAAESSDEEKYSQHGHKGDRYVDNVHGHQPRNHFG